MNIEEIKHKAFDTATLVSFDCTMSPEEVLRELETADLRPADAWCGLKYVDAESCTGKTIVALGTQRDVFYNNPFAPIDVKYPCRIFALDHDMGIEWTRGPWEAGVYFIAWTSKQKRIM